MVKDDEDYDVKPPSTRTHTLTETRDGDVVYDLPPRQVKDLVLGLGGEDRGPWHLQGVLDDESVLMAALHRLVDQVIEVGLWNLTYVEQRLLPVPHQQSPLFVNV